MNIYINKFLKYLEDERNYSDHTVLNYAIDLKDFERFLGAGSSLEGVQYPILRRYLGELRERQ